MIEFLSDSHSWVLISFLCFVAIAIRYGRKAFVNFIETKISAITKELKEAEQLRIEAQNLLADYQRKYRSAVKEAEDIVAKAKEDAAALRKDTEEEWEATTARREAQLNERLERIEKDAMQAVQSYIAKVSIDSSREILSSKMDVSSNKDMIDKILDSLPKTLN